MLNLVGICGCGGGEEGPQSIYKEFSKSKEMKGFSYTPLHTEKDEMEENVKNVIKLLQSTYDSTNNKSILIGHSSGGAAAVFAAHELKDQNPNPLQGVVLINPQTDGLHLLEQLEFPLLIIYGQKDRYFRQSSIEGYFETSKAPKQMILMPNLGHDLEEKTNTKTIRHTRELANTIVSLMYKFFIDKELTVDNSVNLPEKSDHCCNIL